MPRNRSISLSLVFLTSTFCAWLQAANDNPWLEIHSAHYAVITDAGEKKGQEVALHFEQMRAIFASLLGKDRLHDSRPLTILAFKNDASYYRLAPLRQGHPIEVPGFLLPGYDQDFIALNLFEDESWRAVSHDFALRMLNFNYPPTQGWFDEGLAEYFSSMHIEGKQVEIGGDPELLPTVTQDLVGNVQDVQPPKSLTELLGAQIWLSLPDLFTVKHDASTRNEGTRHTLYHAESWIVMHYLLHEKKLSETGAYFGLVLNQHLPVEDAIKQAFGETSSQLEQDVKKYFQSLTGLHAAVDAARQENPDLANPARAYQPDRFPIPVTADDSVITAKPISEADERAIYAGVQVRIPERREFGLKTLQELATTPTEADRKRAEAKPTKRMGEDQDPDQLPSNAIGSPMAHRFLAWDHIVHGQFEEAFTELNDAASLNPRDMWLRYYLSILKYRAAQAKHSDITGLANMMLDLKTVLDWNPELADAYDLLAVARNAGGSSAAATQAERAAIDLNPRDESYFYHLAEIYITGKQWESANHLLERLKASSNPQIAAAARDLIERAGTERKYGVPAASGLTNESKFEPQKSPFDVLEQDAAKRDAAENAGSPHNPADARPTKFVKGRLVTVDCSKAPMAVLTVRSDQGTLKLRTADYKSLPLIGADDFSCDWRDLAITANYKTNSTGAGDLISLEIR